MRGFKINFITIFAFILLIVYAYLAAMGLLYQYGNIPFAGVFFIGIIAVVSLCIFLMCQARATRWQEKIGIPAQITLGIIIVVTFFAIGKPFSSYVTMIGKKDKVVEDISIIVSAARDLSTKYNEYAEKRLADYQPQESSPQRQSIRVEVLRRQLIPPQLASRQDARNGWLDDMSHIDIGNIQTPNNLANIDSCVALWTKDYIRLSNTIFYDERDVIPFAYDDFQDNYKSFRDDLGSYSIWALMVAIICSIFMLLPYFTTDSSLALSEGNQKGLSERVKHKISSLTSEESNETPQQELDYM